MAMSNSDGELRLREKGWGGGWGEQELVDVVPTYIYGVSLGVRYSIPTKFGI